MPKKSYNFYLSPEADCMIDSSLVASDSRSRSDFVEKAVRYYAASLGAETASKTAAAAAAGSATASMVDKAINTPVPEPELSFGDISDLMPDEGAEQNPDALFNDLGTAYLKSCICKSSNRMTSNNIDSSDEETVQQNNYETYIKKSFNSFKIKKEISSFLYSSPDKQKRLITYLTQKFNKMKNNNINNEFEEKQMTKIKKKFFNLKDDDKKEKDESQNDDNNDDNNNDKDEDKTNLKEFSLFSLIMGKKNLKAQSRINHISNFKEKFAECWDNNILKNILPQNIKSKSYINLKSVESNKKYNENSSRSKNIKYYLPSKLKQFNLNSYNKKIINRYKYRHRSLFENDQQTKGLNDIYCLFNNKKLTRAESNF